MSDKYGYTAKTFFCVIHEKSLVNMGIEPKWENAEELKANFESALRDISENNVYTICRSAEGLYHIHLVITFTSAKRSITVAKMLGNCHVEEMRGSKEQAENYIEKRGKFEEKGEQILMRGGSIEKIENNRGKRTDYEEFDKAVLDGTINLNEHLLTLANETEVRNFQARYLRLLQRKVKPFRQIHVIYVEGEAGSGKSYGVIERYPNAYRVSVADKTNFPFNGYSGEKELWLDELRPGVFKHAELMQVLDGYKMNVDVKYGQVPALWETVIITSAMPFDDWYKDSFGRYEVGRKEFQRRIKERYKAYNHKWHKIETLTENDFMPIDNKTDIPFD